MLDEKIELKSEELSKVNGGFTGDPSKYSNANVGIYSANGHALFWGCSIRRISDEKCFKCTGYQNNNDGTTTWVFVNDIGSFEQFIFVATKEENGNILFDFEF